jgi:hypothetical protein
MRDFFVDPLRFCLFRGLSVSWTIMWVPQCYSISPWRCCFHGLLSLAPRELVDVWSNPSMARNPRGPGLLSTFARARRTYVGPMSEVFLGPSRTSSTTFRGPRLRLAKLFPLGTTGGRDTRATSASQISIEWSNPIKLFATADSSGFEPGEMIAIKKFTLFNSVTTARRVMLGRYLYWRITDNSLRQRSFLYIWGESKESCKIWV